MIKALARILLNGLALVVAAHLVPGINYRPDGFLVLVLAGLVVGAVNLLVKPVAVLFSFPLIVVTLGLFYLLLNGLLLQLVAFFVPQLSVQGCLPAILGGLVIGLFNWAVQILFFRE